MRCKAPRAERLRRKIARLLPVAMALLGVFCAAMLTSFSALRFAPPFPDLAGPIAAMSRQIVPTLALLASFGVPPWMPVVALVAIAWALFANQHDQRADFRF